MTPVAPKAAQLRTRVPTFPGSPTPARNSVNPLGQLEIAKAPGGFRGREDDVRRAAEGAGVGQGLLIAHPDVHSDGVRRLASSGPLHKAWGKVGKQIAAYQDVAQVGPRVHGGAQQVEALSYEQTPVAPLLLLLQLARQLDAVILPPDNVADHVVFSALLGSANESSPR